MRHVHQGLFFNVSTSSKPTFSFDIKSGYLSTVNLIFRTTDLQIIEADLKTRFGDVPDFFDDDAVCIDLTALDVAVTTGLNWERLLSMLVVVNKIQRLSWKYQDEKVFSMVI